MNNQGSDRRIDKEMFKAIRENLHNQNDVAPSEVDVSEYQARFRQNIATDAKFVEFSILPDAGNVIFKGSIPGICEWTFEFVNRNGPEINMTQSVTLTDDILDLMKKMYGEFENWRNDWGTKLSEYQNNG